MCLFKMRIRCHRLSTGILAWLLFASFRKQGAFDTKSIGSPAGFEPAISRKTKASSVVVLFAKIAAARAFIQDAVFQGLAWQGILNPKNAGGIFADMFDPKHPSKTAFYI